MKTKLLALAAALMCGLWILSCEKENEQPKDPTEDQTDDPVVPEVVKTEFALEISMKENNLTVKVSSSEADAEYITGVLNEEEYQQAGGEKGLVAYADQLLKKKPEILKGNNTLDYKSLEWFRNYYAYAVQVTQNEGNYAAIENVKVSESTRAERHYIEFVGDLECAPIGMSDNGRYVVGQSMQDSYIYDVYKDEIIYVNGVCLYDISDNGVAFGSNPEFQAVKYENGQVEILALPQADAIEACIFAVSPDGSKAVGYMADADYYFQPIVYSNGQMSILDKGVGPDGNEVVASVIRAIGSNGYLAGYSITADYTEMSNAWDAQGKPVMFGTDVMKDSFNEETGYYDLIIGNMFTYMSPDGKFITSSYTIADPEDVWTTYSYPYIYNTETQELFKVDASVCSDFENLRVDGITNESLVFISDVQMGFSTTPYVYVPGQNKIMEFQEYLESRDIIVEKDMAGSFIGCSQDNKTFLFGNMEETSEYFGYKTIIYIL